MRINKTNLFSWFGHIVARLVQFYLKLGNVVIPLKSVKKKIN